MEGLKVDYEYEEFKKVILDLLTSGVSRQEMKQRVGDCI